MEEEEEEEDEGEEEETLSWSSSLPSSTARVGATEASEAKVRTSSSGASSGADCLCGCCEAVRGACGCGREGECAGDLGSDRLEGVSPRCVEREGRASRSASKAARIGVVRGPLLGETGGVGAA